MSDRLRTKLLVGLLALFALVAVTSATLETARGNPVFGTVGRLAVTLGSFPSLVHAALVEAGDLLSGRELDQWLSVPAEDRDLAGFRAVRSRAGPAIDGLLVEGQPAPAARGWRLLGGVFRVDGEPRHAALLLDPALDIRRVWTFDEAFLPTGVAARDTRKILHGLQVLPDGGIVATFDHGHSIQKRDACGRLVWSRIGEYHHSVALDADRDVLWTMRRGEFPATAGVDAGLAPQSGFVALSPATGEIVQSFSVADIIAANPDAAFLEIPRHELTDVRENGQITEGVWMKDPFHFNDVEPLPAALAPAFPKFEPGDLLISARTLNSIFVLDPDTLQVKWHRTGDTMRQHDPDWLPDGRVSVYNNRMYRGASRIEAVRPGDAGSEVLLDGAEAGFYSSIRGKHQHGPEGAVHVVSPQQAWAFALDRSGARTLQFLNLGRPGTGRNLVLTEFQWFPETYIQPEHDPCED